MALLNYIPERYKSGFKRMASLEENDFEKLQEGLSYTALTSSVSTLAENVAKLKNLDINDLKELFLSAGSLTTFLDSKTVIDDIVNDIVTLALEGELFEDDKKEIFKKRLAFLLGNEQI